MSIIKKKFIFNISPSRVVGAISYFDKEKKKPVIEYIIEEKIKLKKDFNLVDFRKATLLAIDNVCENFILENKILSDQKFFIEDAEVFLMSPWVDYENYSLIDESLTPFISDYKYLDKILSKRKKGDEMEVLSSDILSIKANEYGVNLDEIVNKKIQKLDISFFDSFILNFDKHFINGAIKNHFSILNIKFNSFIPVLLYQIKKIFDPIDDFVFLDISSEITEFGVFSEGNVKEIITIPFGINKILGDIGELKKISLFEARTYFNMYLLGHIHNEDSDKIKEIIEKYTSLIKNEIKKYSDLDLLPFNVYAVSSAWETNRILKESNIFNKIIFIDEKIINQFIYYKTKKRDNFIALEVDYIYTFKN